MDRTTKLLVALWACAAIAAQIWLVPSLWPGFKIHAIAAFVIAAALTTVNRRSIGLVLILAYVYPVLIFMRGGYYHGDFDIIWLAALAGGIMPDALRSGWRLPPLWRAPLALWALVVAIGTTIVLAREIDFYLPLLRGTPPVGNSLSGGGGGPAFLALFIFDVSLAVVVGILWFDWLFGAGLDFHRDVATPLMISALGFRPLRPISCSSTSHFSTTTCSAVRGAPPAPCSTPTSAAQLPPSGLAARSSGRIGCAVGASRLRLPAPSPRGWPCGPRARGAPSCWRRVRRHLP